MSLETLDVVLPEFPILVRPVGDVLEARGLELINPLATFFLLAHEPRGSQNAQVLRDRRPAHSES